jgi:AcrR family transcriptional regulator
MGQPTGGADGKADARTPDATTSARARILRAAAALFARNGVPATGVDRLIDEADVAKATFYRHFSSKDELVAAWLRSPEARWLDEVLAGVDPEAPPMRRLLDIWPLVGGWQERNGAEGCPYLNTLVELRDPDKEAYAEVVSFVGEVQSWFTRTAAEAGLRDPDALGERLRVLMMGALMAVRFEGSGQPLDVARSMAIDLLAGWTGRTAAETEAAAGS